jgi:hypothetical protein
MEINWLVVVVAAYESVAKTGFGQAEVKPVAFSEHSYLIPHGTPALFID